METLWRELVGNGVDPLVYLRVPLRLTVAAIFGGILGLERVWRGKPAGIRTHMLVAAGAALFVAVSYEIGIGASDLSRVIQGVATGVGFLGAGAILKSGEERDIKGLTTAATIWVTAGVGMAVGAGQYFPALVAMILGWGILAALRSIEHRIEQTR